MTATDPQPGVSSPLGPYNHAASITLHDTNELSYVTSAIYVGSGGNINLTTQGGDTVVFTGVPTGTVLKVRAKIVKNTNTTASALVALW